MKKIKTIISLLLVMFLMVPFVNANADTRLNKVKKSLGYSSDDNLQGHTEEDLLTKNYDFYKNAKFTTNDKSFTNYYKEYIPVDGTILVDKVCMSHEDYKNLKIKKLTIEGLDSAGGKFKVKINYDFSTVKYIDPATGEWFSIK